MNGPPDRARRTAPLAMAGLLCAGALLTGCGIPTTGVVSAGEPGLGVQRKVKLYLLRHQDDSLVLLSRTFDGVVGATSVVKLLFQGLSAADARVFGLTTEVPAVPVKVGYEGTTMRVDVGTARLTPSAVDQIACTALTASREQPDLGRPGPASSVTVTAAGTPQPGSPDQASRCAHAAPPSPVRSPPAAVPTSPESHP